LIARRRTRATCAVAALAALLVAGCATVVPQPAPAAAEAVAPSSSFELYGRLSARRGSEGGAATFAWRHDAAADEVDLSTPLGQTLARLRGDARGVEARWPDGRTLAARDWDELTERALGVAIPVRGLSAWVRGVARDGSTASIERDAQGRVALLRQDGWEIVYGYADDAALRASRLTLRYPGVEPTEVRLVLDRWER
jgi:outer membrane lipoprotein LolB